MKYNALLPCGTPLSVSYRCAYPLIQQYSTIIHTKKQAVKVHKIFVEFLYLVCGFTDSVIFSLDFLLLLVL